MKDLTLISVKLSRDLLEKTKLQADREETSVSALIRGLLIKYLADVRKNDVEV